MYKGKIATPDQYELGYVELGIGPTYFYLKQTEPLSVTICIKPQNIHRVQFYGHIHLPSTPRRWTGRLGLRPLYGVHGYAILATEHSQEVEGTHNKDSGSIFSCRLYFCKRTTEELSS